MKRSLILFPTRTPLGQELARDIKLCAEQKYGFSVTIHNTSTAWHFYKACERSDAVVLDATLEERPEDHNYAFATPLNVEHLLIVARSYVPLNFRGIVEGGTARYSDPITPLGQKSNAAILEWLDKELQRLCSHPVKKNLFLKLLPPPIRMFHNQQQSISRKRQRLKEEGRIFISYRSAHHEHVTAFASRLRHGDYGEHYKKAFIFFFEPGELVFEDELLSPLRRWQLLSIIQDYIIAAREVWIFKTQDYLNSWWTRGEVLSTLYFTDERNLPEKLKMYNPDTDELFPIETHALPKLTAAQRKRMARNQVNSHPDMMAPETLDRNQLVEPLANLSAVRRLFMLDDPVFSREFWEYYIVPCKSGHCSPPKSQLERDRAQFQRALAEIDVDDFLSLTHKEDLVVTAQQLERAAQGEEPLVCSRCHQQIIVSAEKPRYLWIPQPHVASRGGNWGRLEELPVYRAG